MVGLADEERGELANVRVRDSEKGLECVAIPHASGTDVDVHVDIPADVTVLSEHQGRGLADAEMEMKGVLVPDAPPGRGRPAIRAGERILRSRREEQGGFAEAGEEGGNGGEEDGGVGAGGGPERRRIEVEEIMDVEEEEVEVGLEGEAEGGSQGMDLSA
ncbi:hypothetical protein MMC08_008116 [Hypocenomyce scalaris]|nr:hypothetical protein [Hypocenomyce scalaris]